MEQLRLKINSFSIKIKHKLIKMNKKGGKGDLGLIEDNKGLRASGKGVEEGLLDGLAVLWDLRSASIKISWKINQNFYII
jgi:hypothetical protein